MIDKLLEDLSDNRRILWHRCIAHHLDMVDRGHISGEWAVPDSKGWRPPVIRGGKVVPQPHHD